MLNQIQDIIKNGISVEVRPARQMNGKLKYPVIVKDITKSVTSGWYIQYNPIAQDNGARLYDGSETFSEVNIANFATLQDYIFNAKYHFLSGVGDIQDIVRNGKPAKRVVYDQAVHGLRFTVTSQPNSVHVMVTVTDETSPFYMMSLPFTVCVSNDGSNSYHIVQPKDMFDNNTGYMKWYDAYFASAKKRFLQIYQEKNTPPVIKTVATQYTPTGEMIIDLDKTPKHEVKYIQNITNQFKALAYIYEQTIMQVAFEKAIAQGLPVTQTQPVANGQIPTPPAGFRPNSAFNVGNLGAPNPAPQVPPAQPQQQAQTPFTLPVEGQGFQAPPVFPTHNPNAVVQSPVQQQFQDANGQEIDSNLLPWG